MMHLHQMFLVIHRLKKKLFDLIRTGGGDGILVGPPGIAKSHLVMDLRDTLYMEFASMDDVAFKLDDCTMVQEDPHNIMKYYDASQEKNFREAYGLFLKMCPVCQIKLKTDQVDPENLDNKPNLDCILDYKVSPVDFSRAEINSRKILDNFSAERIITGGQNTTAIKEGISSKDPRAYNPGIMFDRGIILWDEIINPHSNTKKIINLIFDITSSEDPNKRYLQAGGNAWPVDNVVIGTANYGLTELDAATQRRFDVIYFGGYPTIKTEQQIARKSLDNMNLKTHVPDYIIDLIVNFANLTRREVIPEFTEIEADLTHIKNEEEFFETMGKAGKYTLDIIPPGGILGTTGLIRKVIGMEHVNGVVTSKNVTTLLREQFPLKEGVDDKITDAVKQVAKSFFASNKSGLNEARRIAQLIKSGDAKKSKAFLDKMNIEYNAETWKDIAADVHSLILEGSGA